MSKQTLSDDMGHQSSNLTQRLSSEIKNVLDKFLQIELSDSENQKTKSEYYLQMAEQFEIEGIKKIEISKYTLQVIEDGLYQKLSSEGLPKEQCKLSASSVRHFRRTLSNAGYTDPFYARNKNDDDTKKVYEFEKENKTLIDLFSSQKDIIPDIIHWLKNNECTSKLSQKQLEEFTVLSKQNHQNFYDIFNNKEKLIPVFQHIFNYYMATEASISYTIASYLEKIKTIGTITRKQAVRCQKRLLKGIHCTLEPDSYDMAVFMGFVGQRCPDCKTFKVVEKEDSPSKCRCINCSTPNGKVSTGIFPRIITSKCQYCQIPLYIEDLKIMKKTKGACPNCDHENKIPESMYEILADVI